MPDYTLDDLEFEAQIAEMGDRALLEFVARQGHDMARRVRKLEGRSKRTMGLLGGAGAIIGAAVVGAIDYVMRRGVS